MNKIFTRDWFFYLDSELRKLGLDSDDKSFDEIKENLQHPKKLTPKEFVSTVSYVILASGFSQKTAKRIHKIIMDTLPASQDVLLNIFNNKNKINAIIDVWDNMNLYTENYYKCCSLSDKLDFLQTLPYIGKITANHLARNLGENIVKYDIWIQRLGVLYAKNKIDISKINNADLCLEIKNVCDDMFFHLEKQTGLPRGYIDVVLWKACQNHLIKF